MSINGHPLPEMDEWRRQLDSYDNKGLIWRQRLDQRWDFEDWQRDDLSLSYPEEYACTLTHLKRRPNLGCRFFEERSYQDLLFIAKVVKSCSLLWHW
ncbi:hypothetical protein AK966_09125 [Vibrio sp. PID23_8]|jgi:hypothetical protein|nr:hypothetical protein AK965_11925 [Vibrio sp. PID17_43]RIZ54575.1 hypothetical protein AK966_09125 [Vibrio sp. PID23_8]